MLKIGEDWCGLFENSTICNICKFISVPRCKEKIFLKITVNLLMKQFGSGASGGEELIFGNFLIVLCGNWFVYIFYLCVVGVNFGHFYCS